MNIISRNILDALVGTGEAAWNASRSVVIEVQWLACEERDVVVKVSIILSILLICSLGYFSFQPVVHNWSNKGCSMYCSVRGKVHIKDPLLLIRKSNLCGDSEFPLKKYVRMIIYPIANDNKINVL